MNLVQSLLLITLLKCERYIFHSTEIAAFTMYAATEAIREINESEKIISAHLDLGSGIESPWQPTEEEKMCSTWLCIPKNTSYYSDILELLKYLKPSVYYEKWSQYSKVE